MATKIEFDEYPEGEIESSTFRVDLYEEVVLGGTSSQVISNEFRVEVQIKTTSHKTPGKFKGRLYYQTCDDQKCYFPRVLEFEVAQ